MTKKLRFFLLLFIGLSMAGLAAAVFINFSLKKDSKERVAPGPGAAITKVRYYGIRDSRREWELEADSAAQLKTTDPILLKGVRLVYYAKEGLAYTVRGRDGVYGVDTGEITVEGDVTVESRNGYTLKTDAPLTYTTGRRIVRTNGRIRLLSRTIEVTGAGLIMDMDTEKVSVLKDVRTVL
ncbi:MAG: LPS export ABC transporter periplasmic protein LptC, partial [Deltaproteobacteria bacterium]|nr:LPS export ABC transporter periplasmic protein LptC [Deltaproteobacteria bacterium]